MRLPLSLLALFLATAGTARLAAADHPLATPLPADMAAWFQPPPEFKDQFGNYRSPLLFADGTAVKSKADWTRRREEIVRHWHELMGPWPALIEKPRLEILERVERENFVQCRVRVEIAPGQTTDGYLLFPHGPGKFPAVFVPFYDAETSAGLGPPDHPYRDFAYQLAKRGFVTLAIGSPGGDARKPEPGGAKCQPLSFLAYVAANCAAALANLPEVDARRIGVVGHSYGGKWAMFASCLSERFACAVWSDP
jgi:dipeptidyl aminopeptidase/acylaminoacyl peptidase